MADSSAETVPTFKPVKVPLSRRTGFVYFATDGDLIKIGFSKGPTFRIRAIRSPNKKPMRMIAYFPGHMDEEHNLHRHFKELLAYGAEWFRPDDKIINFIAELELHRGYFEERVIGIDDVLFRIHAKYIEAWHAEGRMLLRRL